jgi:hypothetical protein
MKSAESIWGWYYVWVIKTEDGVHLLRQTRLFKLFIHCFLTKPSKPSYLKTHQQAPLRQIYAAFLWLGGFYARLGIFGLRIASGWPDKTRMGGGARTFRIRRAGRRRLRPCGLPRGDENSENGVNVVLLTEPKSKIPELPSQNL